MNTGKTAGQLAVDVQLPPEYAGLPYLTEHYGCVEWTIRSIYSVYLGWFSRDPTHLHLLSPEEHSRKTIALVDGVQTVLDVTKTTLSHQEYQWCLELCDLLLSNGNSVKEEILHLKASLLEELTEYETSANGRHHCMVCAKEMDPE